MNKLIDLADTSDIPIHILDETRLYSAGNMQGQVMNLIREIGHPVTIDMMLVAYYRLYNQAITRKECVRHLNALMRHGLLENAGKQGIYQIANREENESI